jgi:hypothetical protein
VAAPLEEGKKGGDGFRGGTEPVIDLTRPFGNLLLQLGIEVYAVGVDDLKNLPEMQGIPAKQGCIRQGQSAVVQGEPRSDFQRSPRSPPFRLLRLILQALSQDIPGEAVNLEGLAEIVF